MKRRVDDFAAFQQRVFDELEEKEGIRFTRDLAQHIRSTQQDDLEALWRSRGISEELIAEAKKYKRLAEKEKRRNRGT